MSEDVDGDTRALSRQPRTARATWWIVALALVTGLALGRWGSGGLPAVAADPSSSSTPITAESSPNATITRAAELTELADLRTKVAQPVVCTVAPTDTPTATPSPEPTATQIPPVPAETVLSYQNTWQITVHSIQTVPSPNGFKVSGQLVKVTLTFENVSDDPQSPPFGDWRLVDSSGRKYSASISATTAVTGNGGYGASVGGHTSADRALVFDIAVDAGSTFILESTQDPTFRVQLNFEARG